MFHPAPLTGPGAVSEERKAPRAMPRCALLRRRDDPWGSNRRSTTQSDGVKLWLSVLDWLRFTAMFLRR